ncbi:MAG: hypothetical protein WA130_16400 [Candidatus Methanoperedens sp.]
MKHNMGRIGLISILAVIIFISSATLASSIQSLDNDPLHQLPATSGKISWFSSRDVTGYCDGAAWSEKLGEDCGNDETTKYWYVAMRWPYVNGVTESEQLTAKTWWHNKKILVTNPNNGKQVVLAAKDWGPNEKTGRVIDVSKTALDTLGAVTDNMVNIEFANQDSSFGSLINDVSSSEDSRIEQSITWAESMIGSTKYPILCLAFVEDAYKFGAKSNPTRLWGNAKKAAVGLNAKNNIGLPPRGSFVFFEWTSNDCLDCGHVGLSLGDGNIIHAFGRSPVKKSEYSKIGLTYIGWAYPPVTPPLTIKPSWEFNTAGNLEGWDPHNIEGAGYSVENGVFFIDPAESDPWIEKNGLYIDAASVNSIIINMSSNAPDKIGTIYFTTVESSSYYDDKKVEFNVLTGQDWHEYKILMVVNPFWKGTITGLRIDPSNKGMPKTNQDTVGFDYIRVEKSNIILAQSLYPYPNTINAGEKLTFVYNIENSYSNDLPIKIRLGAQIRTNDPKGEWVDDMPNDGIEILKPGATDYSRFFLNTYDLKPGYYDAHWVVMDEGTKRWIDNKELSQILIVGSNGTPIATPSFKINDTQVNEIVKTATSTLEKIINKFINLLHEFI